MSIQTPTTRAIVFDIETIPQDEAKLLASLPPFDPAEVKVGNLKDAEKIAAKIAEAEAKHKARWLSEAALSPVTGRVAMIGSMESIDGLTMATSIFYLQKDTITEETLLAGFWGYWESTLREEYTLWVGHNVFDFDLPFMVNRSRILGVTVPRSVYSFKGGRVFWADRIIDTRPVWLMGRKAADCPSSLDHISRALDLGEKSGSGSDFAALFASDTHAAAAYCKRDLELTAAIARRLAII
jgi:hypothetical protein